MSIHNYNHTLSQWNVLLLLDTILFSKELEWRETLDANYVIMYRSNDYNDFYTLSRLLHSDFPKRKNTFTQCVLLQFICYQHP